MYEERDDPPEGKFAECLRMANSFIDTAVHLVVTLGLMVSSPASFTPRSIRYREGKAMPTAIAAETHQGHGKVFGNGKGRGSQ